MPRQSERIVGDLPISDEAADKLSELIQRLLFDAPDSFDNCGFPNHPKTATEAVLRAREAEARDPGVAITVELHYSDPEAEDA